ncbi:FtsX-like permease family protein [Roseivirga pacifica]|nr:FtsX-like permease family protein [Roseivirga pacifica]MCO6366987.1 FtsX-like permease family protein [Roseivirga pacifica]MCO6370481.1 FtsX-like permease family protein [Roseivirga pacifica]MCO6374644.1 FtsX-like permease family protein [Roseivirga pacifica]MCO6379902.1 FtsX-like permease family protein [Roseivirga pacifica]
MAWRDARKSKARLFLFISSIVIGIAALVAINSFSDNLKNDINNQAKELLGADLELGSNDSTFNYAFVDTLDYEVSYENSFASMVYFPKTQESRLVDVRALAGEFPYYGTIETEPIEAENTFRDGQAKALVDQSVMIQYGIEIGDSIKVGQVTFKVEGSLISSPSQSFAATLVAPAVYIPMKYLNETGLVQRGSRVYYRRFYKFNDLPEDFDFEAQVEADEDTLRLSEIRVETIEERKEETGETFQNLANFLNLVAFVALLLGCVGVASAVHIYMKEKVKTVAILRCMGAKGRDAFQVFLIQMAVVGLIGSILGAFAGTLIQTVLPKVFADFLPVEVTLSLSWPSIIGGIITGLFISVLFALSPLIAVRKASPLISIRGVESTSNTRDPLRWLVYAGIAVFIIGFAFVQMKDLQDSIVFTFAILVAFGFLGLVAKFFMWLVKRLFPASWSYVWRQSLANLYRPNNQTLVLIASIGLGTALITTLYFIQGMLISQVEITTDENRPNMMVFDMQTYQKDGIAELAKSYDLPILQEVPIVTMRLKSVNDTTYEQILADTTIERRGGIFRREWRVTYRDTLIESEKVVQGELRKVNTPNDSIFVSLEEDYATRNNIALGDKLVWDVQGVPITTYLGSTREIDWERVQTNFLALFPANTLEPAPQFHVLITRVPSTEVGALFQRDVVKQYPSVSVIDIGLILNTVDDILDKIAFVIRFMALFSILTGLLVLVSSVILSKFQRIKESVLLRTMGGSKKQILTINSLEYFFLGSLASLSGILLALAGSWGLAFYSFDSTFIPNPLPMVVVFVSITSLTVVIGLLNSRGILSKPPLEVLRNEIQ